MRYPERPKERGYVDLFFGAGSGKPGPGLMKYPRSPGLLPGAVSVGESITPHTAGRVRIQKSAQNGCSFTQNFGIRQNCPRIAVFQGKSGFSKTLIYAFGRQISLRIGLGYLKTKRRPVLGVSKRCRSCYYFHFHSAWGNI